jgi:hypothetical protein
MTNNFAKRMPLEACPCRINTSTHLEKLSKHPCLVLPSTRIVHTDQKSLNIDPAIICASARDCFQVTHDCCLWNKESVIPQQTITMERPLIDGQRINPRLRGLFTSSVQEILAHR